MTSTKIILGYEELDQDLGYGWNLNGRISPSDISATPEQFNQLNDFTRQVYKLVIEPHNNLTLQAEFMGSTEHPNIISLPIRKISDEKYIYPIEINSASVYHTYTSHIAISDRVMHDIRNGQAYLVFIYHREGDIRYYIEKFRELVTQLDLPKDRVFLCHGDYDTDFFKDEPFTYVPVNCLQYWLANYNRSSIVNYIPDKLFVNYNRIPREHRIIMLSLLYQYDMIKHGIVSCGPLNDGNIIKNYILPNNFEQNICEELFDFLMKLSGQSPDGLALGTDNPAQNIVHDHYVNTFVSLVSETLTDSIFFSEKIYKPILMGHPFILMGAPGQLKVLRSFGFRTFNKWWNEDYDEIPNTLERAKHIAELLNTLSKKTTEELIKIRMDMRLTLLHNQNVYNNMINRRKVCNDRQPIIDFLQQISKNR